jgi:rod shape determining protein RodA
MGQKKGLLARVDWQLFALYCLITMIGVFSIYSVEYRGMGEAMAGNSYSKQAMWMGISLLVGFVILITDSKLFSAIPYGSYLIGIFLLIVVLFFHENVRGSKSFLPLGPVRFQPGELAKIFTSLTIAKFLSTQGIDIAHNNKHRLVAMALIMVPSVLVIASSETGLALVYFSLFLALYREGLPGVLFIVVASFIVLALTTLLLTKKAMLVFLIIVLIAICYWLRKVLRRNRELMVLIIALFGFSVLFSQVLIPFAFKNVLKGYQVDRIYTMLGKDMPEEYVHVDEAGNEQKKGGSEYNVKQSKIAIGSGGILGKGPLNGTQTQGNFVPEQTTDFVFCSIGEQFGLWGSLVLIGLYILFLFKLIQIAERQRSRFNRVYSYCIAGIVLFHLTINIGMTIGLAPVIGIPLPMMSYGGTSLLTFSMLIFILLRLDAERI